MTYICRAALLLTSAAAAATVAAGLAAGPAAAKPWPDPPRTGDATVVVRQVEVPVEVPVDDNRTEALQMGAAALLGALTAGIGLRLRRRTAAAASDHEKSAVLVAH